LVKSTEAEEEEEEKAKVVKLIPLLMMPRETIVER
jgi:hypothetical protein